MDLPNPNATSTASTTESPAQPQPVGRRQNWARLVLSAIIVIAVVLGLIFGIRSIHNSGNRSTSTSKSPVASSQSGSKNTPSASPSSNSGSQSSSSTGQSGSMNAAQSSGSGNAGQSTSSSSTSSTTSGTLVNTGPGTPIGVFAAVTVVGTAAYEVVTYRRTSQR
ncbi:MAG TPA: hypothetical protein VFN56_02520 [Candidatus Saccharimonadales bacterium]|nr:hypothetical protein [Candidatus Saccharimonadales bacterium]